MNSHIEIIQTKHLKTIYFAGGCFWGVEAYFSHISGVVKTSVGYANGTTQNPSYEDVCQHNSGHAETVEVIYDTHKISLQDLVEYFFKIIDPTSINRQGNDVGIQYRTGIYYLDYADKDIIAEVTTRLQSNYTQALAIELGPLEHYYSAEEYHQQYLRHTPNGYCHLNLNKLLKGT